MATNEMPEKRDPRSIPQSSAPNETAAIHGEDPQQDDIIELTDAVADTSAIPAEVPGAWDGQLELDIALGEEEPTISLEDPVDLSLGESQDGGPLGSVAKGTVPEDGTKFEDEILDITVDDLLDDEALSLAVEETIEALDLGDPAGQDSFSSSLDTSPVEDSFEINDTLDEAFIQRLAADFTQDAPAAPLEGREPSAVNPTDDDLDALLEELTADIVDQSADPEETIILEDVAQIPEELSSEITADDYLVPPTPEEMKPEDGTAEDELTGETLLAGMETVDLDLADANLEPLDIAELEFDDQEVIELVDVEDLPSDDAKVGSNLDEPTLGLQVEPDSAEPDVVDLASVMEAEDDIPGVEEIHSPPEDSPEELVPEEDSEPGPALPLESETLPEHVTLVPPDPSGSMDLEPLGETGAPTLEDLDLEEGVAADDDTSFFEDSISLSEDADAFELSLEVDDNAAVSLPEAMEAALPMAGQARGAVPSQAELKAALEQVVTKMYGQQINDLLSQVIERTVHREIRRLKEMVLEEPPEK